MDDLKTVSDSVDSNKESCFLNHSENHERKESAIRSRSASPVSRSSIINNEKDIKVILF